MSHSTSEMFNPLNIQLRKGPVLYVFDVLAGMLQKQVPTASTRGLRMIHLNTRPASYISLQPKTSSRSGQYISGYCTGSIGRLVQLHAHVYKELCGFDSRFEAFVARELGDFIENFDPTCDGFWLYRDAENVVGCIAIDGHDRDGAGARLRFLIVDPDWGNQGIGTKLMAQAINFCKKKQMPKIYLMTTPALRDARRLYDRFGFVQVGETLHDDWGVASVHQRFELNLANDFGARRSIDVQIMPLVSTCNFC